MKSESIRPSTPCNRLLYEAKDFPVFQNRMYDNYKEALDCPKGDIRLVEDINTGLIYNEAFRPELVLYDSNYQNEQALSPSFEQHLNSMAGLIERNLGRAKLVEVGCGKGHFLELLLNRGFDVTGFDPAYEGSNPKIKQHKFEKDIGISAKGIILRHVLEHIQDPVSFLKTLRDANNGEGAIYIEVPCFDWICKRKAWFDVYYEHVNYFRIADFHRMFGEIRVLGHSFGGQYLYVLADLASLKSPVIDDDNKVSFPTGFLSKLKVVENPENAAVWGGASKGVIFSLLKSRAGSPIETIIDINPAKQGKYISASGLRVLSPDEGLSGLSEGSIIYVMNSNYLEEIKLMSRNAYHYVTVDYE